MYNNMKKANVKAKPIPSKITSVTSGLDEENDEHNEKPKTSRTGIPICPVSGDSGTACDKIICLNKAKIKNPYNPINTAKPGGDLHRDKTERSRSDMMYDKTKQPEKPLPRCPQPFPPLPPRRDPYEEQQRRAIQAEYRQRLLRYHGK